MIKFILEKEKEDLFQVFKVNKAKFNGYRIVWACLFVLFALFSSYSFQNISLALIGVPLLGYLGYKLPYVQLLMQKNRVDKIKSIIFPIFLRYFISLLETQGNVYQTLKATLKYVKHPLLHDELQKLVNAIEKKNDRNSYLDFAHYIGTPEAVNVMSIIYDFSEHGVNKKDLKELETIIYQLHFNKTNELIKYKVNAMEKYANPVLITCVLFTLSFVAVSLVMTVNDALSGL
ncbi:flagellar assembly protein FlaJ [Halalkalibacterium halodurans]|uniref:flagellar assembly protein FlaJ n=1 Tax=Halalkalibacterium halodurans TaxID=86665 RepID=UPI001068950E|nr:flagellar assembly protein FlaJ [Halalkalibacterium halodurans]TES48807.1 flagellar assembly protein FlaJ [Halalkalibacterium halodurans]